MKLKKTKVLKGQNLKLVQKKKITIEIRDFSKKARKIVKKIKIKLIQKPLRCIYKIRIFFLVVKKMNCHLLGMTMFQKICQMLK